MDFTTTHEHLDCESLATVQTDCLVIGIHPDRLEGLALHVDTLTDGLIGRTIDSRELSETAGTWVVLHEPKGLLVRRLLLVNRGPASRYTPAQQRASFEGAAQGIKSLKSNTVLWCLSACPAFADQEHPVPASILAMREAFYRFTSPTAKNRNSAHHSPGHVKLLLAQQLPNADRLIADALAVADGVDLCRTLGNLPPNVCTPTYLAETAARLGDAMDIHVTVLEQEQIAALGMNAFLAVAKGSLEAPRFIVMEYRGGGEQAPCVLVGKGVTFDSGGISLKPDDAMDEMKYDMCGAAAVLGTLSAAAQMQLPINVTGIIAACENMPGPNALRPGDVISSMSAKTIEVLNTDAEGRLILCDALTYAKGLEPAVVIDVATLTGACVVALGHVHSGLYSNDECLANALEVAARKSNDTVWRMPLDDAYQQQLTSNFADLPNLGSKGAGSVTAACFLSHFVGDHPWAHLDIAGTAWRTGALKGATGRPVRLLVEYLISRAYAGAR